MAATLETAEQVRDLTEQKYKYGFVTDIEADTAPTGLNEDTVRFISAKKNEPEWMLEWRLKAYRHWLTMDEPNWAKRRLSARSTTRPSSTTRRPRQKDGPKSLDEVDPELLRTYEKLGIPLRGAGDAARPGVAVDAVFDSVSVGDHLQGEAGRAGHHLLLVLRGGARTSGAGAASTSASVVPYTRQLLRGAELGGVHRRLVRLHPQGRALPDGAVDLLPHQRQEHRPVRAHADHRRRGRYVSYLEGCTAPMRDENQLHAAVVELVALDDAQIKYSTVQNWYPGDKDGKGGIYNFVTKRGACRGAQLEDLLDPGRDRLGDHLEVPELHPAGRRLGRRVLLGRAHQQPPAGRHRHQDDPHRQEHPSHDRLQGHLRRPRPEHLSRPGARS